jgi:hypothetical protein
MTVVAKRFGERAYSPKQLVPLVVDEVVAQEVPSAAKEVAEALEAYSKASGIQRLDQMVKSGDFTEFLLARLFPDDG